MTGFRSIFRAVFFVAVFMVVFVPAVHAAEVTNETSRQLGNRMVFSYDLNGREKTADVTITLTIKGKRYTSKDLHLEGDYGKVRPGKGKKIYWNVLQDFPRGLHGSFVADVEATGGPVGGMVYVKGGCFDMGDTFGEGDSDERPVHRVCLDAFYMGKYEVTQAEWKAIMGSNTSYFRNCGGRCPVENVSWSEVQEYIRKLNRKSGRKYRLPTEAEWEYAAREGGKRVRFGTGKDTIGPDEANYDASKRYKKPYSRVGIYRKKTIPVGSFAPNTLGLYDMSGNVWEWVSDWYGEDYYSHSPRNNPKGPSSGTYRVLRGGSWDLNPRNARAALRNRHLPEFRNNDDGFRLSLSAQD